jgi:hypothetical protein
MAPKGRGMQEKGSRFTNISKAYLKPDFNLKIVCPKYFNYFLFSVLLNKKRARRVSINHMRGKIKIFFV